MGFKIVTWNINGLRSFGCSTAWRKIFTDFNADLVCLQETKINRSAVEEWMAFVPDFTSYFAFPRGQLQTSGYSGVATFCRETTETRPSGAEATLYLESDEIFPKECKQYEFDELDEEYHFSERWPAVHRQQTQIGLPPSQLGVYMWKLVDSEGRCIITKHSFNIDGSESVKNLFIFNNYCPRNDTTRPERQHFQLRFYHMLEKRALQLLKESTDNYVIILGDLNTTHRPDDVYDDDQWGYAGSHSRVWLDQLLSKKLDNADEERCFFDAFRYLNPDATKSFTCWNVQLGCRATNFGSRLDYIIIDQKLLTYLRKCYPLTDYLGSDHCPVVAEFDDRITFTKNDTKFSSHSTKVWPEFGRSSQMSIKNFFTNGSREEILAKMQKSPSNSKRPVPEDESTTVGNRPKKRNGQATLRNYFQAFKVKTDDKGQLVVNTDTSQSASVQPETSTQPFVPPSPVIIDENSNSLPSSEPPASSASLQQNQADQWKALFRQEPPPLCTGHLLPCVKRKVRKQGATFGREFYACPKNSVGPADHVESRCNFFRWVGSKQTKSGVKQKPTEKTTADIDDLLGDS